MNDLENAIYFCKVLCEMDDESTNELIECADQRGISVEYLCEEFIFDAPDTNVMKYHREDYFDLDVFNTLYHD